MKKMTYIGFILGLGPLFCGFVQAADATPEDDNFSSGVTSESTSSASSDDESGRGRIDYRAMRNQKIVAGAAAANARADNDLQREYKERIIDFITQKELIDPVTHEPFIAKERLATDLPLPIRAQIINQLLGDYDFDKALNGIKPELFEEIFARIDMLPSYFKVGVEMVNRLTAYEKLCVLMRVGAETAVIIPEAVAYDHVDADQDFYQDIVIKAIIEPRRKKELTNKRLTSRTKLMIINQLLDNDEFKNALGLLREDRFERVRNEVGLPSAAFNVDEANFEDAREGKLELYLKLRRVMGL